MAAPESQQEAAAIAEPIRLPLFSPVELELPSVRDAPFLTASLARFEVAHFWRCGRKLVLRETQPLPKDQIVELSPAFAERLR